MPELNDPADDQTDQVTTPTDIGNFYLDAKTGEIHEGKVAAARHRLGPYPSREAAQQAYSHAEERNESWEAEDREWNAEE
ncbi:SPOR domain-containing protein [Georgenia sunbinii]|uniref:SPOR domain-containing protein n=1 Tax=Georgenia sunbinii TaxID=3117728 RepID=UPI002F26468D